MLPVSSNLVQYISAPTCRLFIVLITYRVFPLRDHLFSLRIGVLFFYIIVSINIYPVLISGWASNRKYALIGALRSIAQTVSYEVRLALILIFFLTLRARINLFAIMGLNRLWWKFTLFAPMCIIWLISCLAETNRTPFDFAEGESELVSGFNIEYGRLGFALLFMAEYARIILISILFSVLFLANSTLRVTLYISRTFLMFVWVWFRTTFPRYRYDKLINLAWKTYLPITLFLLAYRIYVFLI